MKAALIGAKSENWFDMLQTEVTQSWHIHFAGMRRSWGASERVYAARQYCTQRNATTHVFTRLFIYKHVRKHHSSEESRDKRVSLKLTSLPKTWSWNKIRFFLLYSDLTPPSSSNTSGIFQIRFFGVDCRIPILQRSRPKFPKFLTEAPHWSIWSWEVQPKISKTRLLKF